MMVFIQGSPGRRKQSTGRVSWHCLRQFANRCGALPATAGRSWCALVLVGLLRSAMDDGRTLGTDTDRNIRLA